MEPTMISIRILSTAAVRGVAVAMAAPSAGFAQGRGTPRGGVHIGGGGGVPHFSGGGGPHFGGGGGGGWHGGYGGGYRHGGGGGLIPGAIAGAIIGGGIASAPYGYY